MKSLRMTVWKRPMKPGVNSLEDTNYFILSFAEEKLNKLKSSKTILKCL